MSPPKRKRFLIAVADHSILIAAAVMFLAPFVFIVLTSLMTNDQALAAALARPVPMGQLRRCLSHRADLALWAEHDALLGARHDRRAPLEHPVAYALSRLRWRGQDAVFVLVLGEMGHALPGHGRPGLRPGLEAAPRRVAVAADHPELSRDAFSVFLLRQFLLTIPKEYVDAARVTGAVRSGPCLGVLPLAKPAIAAVALF